MREISQSDTPAALGTEKNPSITVYDTSGPYTDPQAMIDVRQGLPALRSAWVEQRGDTESYAGRKPFALDDGIKSGESDVYVYMPDEFVNDIFALGAKYQRTQITAQQAIDAVQNIVNQLCRYELGLEEPFQALTFLREELQAQAQAEEEARQAQADADGGGEES